MNYWTLRRSLPLSLALSASLLLPSLTRAADLFVSPRGNDANPGTKDQPFASLDKARLALRARPAKNEPATVWISAGTYYLPDTLTFEPADSGAKDASITFAPIPGDQVVLSGGRALSLAWTPFHDGILQASVPKDFAADQLFVNGQRQHMARYPNFNPDILQFNGYARDAFSPARAARWADPAGGYMHAMHNALWGDFHYLITGKNDKGELTCEGGWQNNRRRGCAAFPSAST